jgi:hypothetical protein
MGPTVVNFQKTDQTVSGFMNSAPVRCHETARTRTSKYCPIIGFERGRLQPFGGVDHPGEANREVLWTACKNPPVRERMAVTVSRCCHVT